MNELYRGLIYLYGTRRARREIRRICKIRAHGACSWRVEKQEASIAQLRLALAQHQEGQKELASASADAARYNLRCCTNPAHCAVQNYPASMWPRHWGPHGPGA